MQKKRLCVLRTLRDISKAIRFCMPEDWFSRSKKISLVTYPTSVKRGGSQFLNRFLELSAKGLNKQEIMAELGVSERSYYRIQNAAK